jgi:hypothetical protein
MKIKLLKNGLTTSGHSICALNFRHQSVIVKPKQAAQFFRRSLCTMMLGVGTLGMAGTAAATLMESIDSLEDGAKYRVLFVTSDKSTGASFEITDYNTFVTNLAANGEETKGLGLSWTAFASTSAVSAMTNTGILKTADSTVTMFNTNGEVVANSGAALWNESLNANIYYNENGTRQVGENIWTGINPGGQFPYTVLGGGVEAIVAWNSGTSSNRYWLRNGDESVSDSYSMYAASSVGTKGAANVPEPTTLAIFALGLLGLVSRRFKKQA